MSFPTVFIDGDQGTTGLQIHERLRERTDLQLITLPGAERKDPQRRAEAINACDIAILCLPDAAARAAVGFIRNPAVRVIDASSAHRTQSDWVYGFPEMVDGQLHRITEARRLTNPGCYPTGAIALLRPLLEAALLPRDYPVTIYAISGYSGGGRAAIDAHESSGTASLQVYGLALEHKHTPEIQLHAGLAHRPFFVPAYGAYRQGIVLTVPIELRLLPSHVDGERLHARLVQHYANARHVEVMPLADAHAMTHLDPQALNG
ncbi:MAG: N-acetyl-gamma-glutamyl-phosphate reductase, partial [Paraburkholderia sp.]|nr:N-acetyl-gamma-glutamyl-phosphate reductase [Paraburkholderia sp.]